MAGDVSGTSGLGSEPEPSDSMRTFGAVVQALREHAGLSREQLGEHVRYSKHTVASVEGGRRMPPPDFVERAEPVLGDTGVLRRSVPHVVRKPGLARWFRAWAQLETEAISLSTYECRMIPGLLQTKAYARTLFEYELPPLDDEQIEAQWEARAARQRLLRERPNTAFSFILDKHLFLRRMGAVEVAREQIDHVMEIAELRNVQIQVMPLVAHCGLHGPIVLLETDDNCTYAYSEGQESGQLISDPKVVSVFQRRYARMSAQALTPEDSLSLLQQIRGDL
ncbi:helix-turn-helix domain-containing protein [Streptomyces sp. NBC_01808]|uniref:helix-turn-helix domain-containing protein n=1 Tax=Streptomyces sp. NBC_01808 TaxID=2975947 RepID=UPI002DDBB442|nr:helix-turn-helix transcriptional regulator [Streptomyces sp. NBC_01808]WSA38223.1 helix-turn-helix domain-containing protein [Streptomyces sp. NBC_01808]